MADQTQRLEIATVKAEIGSDILSRFSNDAVVASPIPTDSGDIPNLKQVIAEIQAEGADKISFATTIYPNTADGIAATSNGAIFLVKSIEDDEIYSAWENVAGVATDTGKRALSSQAIQDAMVAADASADAAADSAAAAQAAAANAAAEFESIFEAEQAERVVEFNHFLESSGFEVPVDYVAGLGITRPTQTVRFGGELYRGKDASLPFTTTTWAADSAKFFAIGDAALRQELASETNPLSGAALVHTISPLAGAVGRSIAAMMRDFILVKNYGSVADGQSHPLGERFATLASAQLHYSNVPITSLVQEIDWAATQCALFHAEAKGASVLSQAGAYVHSDTLIVPPAVRWFGEGPMDSPSNTPDTGRFFRAVGTTHFFKGTGAKVHKANLAACDGTTTGSVYTNLSAVEPGYDTTYRLSSFWNNDANPTTGAAATQKLFSVGVKVLKGGFSQVRDMSFIPWFGAGGVAGYNTAALSLADNWDVGLWVDNHHDLTCSRVTVVGYWRMAGLFGRTAITSTEAPAPDWERNKFTQCIFQGWASVLIRGADLYDIKAVGADTIDMDWFDSHPFDPAFDNVIRTQEYGGTFHTYTGTQKVGSLLRLTGVTPSPASINPADAANKVILGTRTNGVADSNFDSCYFYGLNHQGAVRATSAALGADRYTSPSRAIEVSGASVRGLKFDFNCKVITGDDLAIYQGNSLGLQYFGSLESKSFEGRGVGMRMIANSTTYQTYIGQAIRGSSGLDCRPYFPTSDGRFTDPSDLGMFNPNQCSWDGWNHGVTGNVDLRPGSTQSVRALYPNGDPHAVWSVNGEYNLFSATGVRLQRYLPSTDTMTFRQDVLSISTAANVLRFQSNLNDVNLYGAISRLWNSDGTVAMWRNDYATATCDHYGRLRPDGDGSRNLGDVSRRYGVLYAATGAINTSDGREKTPMRAFNEAELAAARDLAGEIGVYKFLASVAEKGEAAREHVGMYVQTAIEIMERHGLDPFGYSFICHDQWDDEYQEIPAEYVENDEGDLVEVAPAYQRLVTPAGDRYSFRPDGLSLFISAGQEQRLRKLESLLPQSVPALM
jgi:hypothetical protein